MSEGPPRLLKNRETQLGGAVRSLPTALNTDFVRGRNDAGAGPAPLQNHHFFASFSRLDQFRETVSGLKDTNFHDIIPSQLPG